MLDYLIVGSGLFGSVFAQLAKQAGYTVSVIEKRSHIGGNIFTENIKGINVHKYCRSEKKPVHKVVMTDGKRAIIRQLLQEHDIETDYSSHLRAAVQATLPPRNIQPRATEHQSYILYRIPLITE